MRRLIWIFVLFLFFPFNSLAWNREGHYAVAAIAYSRFSTDERNSVDAVLRFHPFYEKWRNEYKKLTFKPIGFKEYAFIKAAGWPDDVRSKRYKDQYHHGTWHYVNFPCTPPNSLNTNNAIGTGKLLEKIQDASDTIRNDTSAAQREDRAIMLSWLIHLVGDLHQPLHSVALVNETYPEGDHGGNFFFVLESEDSDAVNLHSFWDGILGDAQSVSPAVKLAAKARTQTPFAAAIASGTHKDWAKESARMGLQSAYQYRNSNGSLHPIEGSSDADGAVPLPADYAGQIRKLAMKRIAFGGYRLGELIKELL